MTQDENRPHGYASPPCLAQGIDPTYFDPLAVDPQQATDAARWRKAERARLLAERHAAAEAIAERLDTHLAARFKTVEGLTISAWWPILVRAQTSVHLYNEPRE